MKKFVKKYPEWIYPLLPVILAVLLYANTIPNKYCLDDYCVIVNNTYVQSGLQGIPKLLSTNFFNGFNGFNDGLYRPAPMVTYAVEYTLFDLNPHVSHAVNLMLFALAGFVLYLLMKRICSDMHPLLPLSIALLYIAHPVHTEVVGNIKGRDDLLAFLFGILAMYYFLRYISKQSVPVLSSGIGFYLLSLLSKESSLMFLFVIPLMIFLFTKASRKNQLMFGTVLAVITLGWLLLRYAIVNSMPTPVDKGIFSSLNNSILATDDITSRLATGFYLQFLYILKMVVPFPLSHDYSYNQIPPVGILSFQFIISLLVLAAVCVVLFISFRRNKLIFYGILFYFFTIATVSNIVIYIGATFAERFLFTPSLGFSIVTGALLAMLLKSMKPQEPLPHVLASNKGYSVILIFVLVIYSGVTVSRNRDWLDNLTLYSKDVTHSPKSARAHYNYGSELMARSGEEKNENKKNGMLKVASVELNQAVAIFPSYLDAFNNLGNVYAALNNRDSATFFYARSIRIDSSYMKGYFNLGINYYSMGRFADAIPLLEKYAFFRPETPQIYYYIGNALGSIGKFDEAIISLEKNLALHGEDPSTLLLLGKAYGFKGQLARSLEIFNRALTVDRNNADVLFNIGLTYSYLGEPVKSIEFYQKAVQLNPGLIPAYTELARAYDRIGKVTDANLIRSRVIQLQKNQ